MKTQLYIDITFTLIFLALGVWSIVRNDALGAFVFGISGGLIFAATVVRLKHLRKKEVK